jgi:shikimate dehydrogenase
MMMESRELYGLIGWPVKHSYSAFMHNAAFKHYGMNAVYELFEVASKDLDAFFKKTVVEKKIRGFNVTVPHKEAAFSFLKLAGARLDDTARRMGSINTVRLDSDGQFSGFNTDGAGFIRDLKERGFDVKGKKVAFLGAGGGARALAVALRDAGAGEALVYDIDSIKKENLTILYGRDFAKGAATIEELWQEDVNIIINATPVGMKPADPLLVKKEWLRAGQFVYDLIYNPAETKLLTAAKAAGCQTANGSGMLLYQGALAFEHWTGKPAPVEVMRRALKEAMRA